MKSGSLKCSVRSTFPPPERVPFTVSIDGSINEVEMKDDWTKVTARAITKEAGVNLAMINYCFGSKEALIYAVFKNLQEEVKKCKPELDEILHSDMSPKEKLIEGYFQMLRLMIDYYSMSHSVVKFCVFDRALEMDDGTFTLLKEHFAGEKTDACLDIMKCMLCKK